MPDWLSVKNDQMHSKDSPIEQSFLSMADIHQCMKEYYANNGSDGWMAEMVNQDPK
jgi:hypothetical protein